MPPFHTQTPGQSSIDSSAVHPRAWKTRARRIVHTAVPLVVLVASMGGPIVRSVQTQTPAEAAYAGIAPVIDASLADRPLHLAPATAAPIAAPHGLAAARLAQREVFAFAPYWTLDTLSGFDLRHITTVAYFGVDVTKDGSIEHADNGWVGYESQDLADLISRAHESGIRVVLTIKTFSNDTIHALATDPAAEANLARNTIDAVKAKNFDGVNIDFEGTGNSDRIPFAILARSLADVLHRTDPAWQVTVDTYVTSAADSLGFFDVGSIAPAIDSFFVMGYDMYRRGFASPNAPLPSYADSVNAYVQDAQPSKVILGAPFYGYDWPTTDNTAHATATAAPTPVTYADIVAGAHPRYWDSNASVPWTAYRVGDAWHEIYYDDASSIALKARLANNAHLRGTGAWALGMNGSDADLVAALLGVSTQIIRGAAGPAPAGGSQSQGQGAPPSNEPRPQTTSSPKPKTTASTSPRPSPSPTPSSLPIPLPPL